MSRERDIFDFWMSQESLEPALREELNSVREDEEGVTDRFYKELAFGTSGLRGIMGAGTNRMNVHVLDRATQGVARYLLAKEADPKVGIAYDTRNNSERFAKRVAEVLEGNGVSVCLFSEPAPVPALSYAIRRLGLSLGIMLTASHNPKEYNGYKVYGPTGCQIVGDVPEEIYRSIQEQDYFAGILREPLPEDCFIDDAVLGEFIDLAVEHSLPGGGEADLRIVYTPLHGVGAPFVLGTLAKAGFLQVMPVESQMVRDGNFPTCPFPNPERPVTFTEAVKVCDEWQGDIILATDPDSDRISFVEPSPEGYWYPSGNQIGVLLANYLCENQEDVSGKTLIRTIVTTDFVDRICKAHGVSVRTTLTGFKYICTVMDEVEDRFLMGFEEATGYLAVPYIRDKDGVSSALLIAQMAAFYKRRGLTLKEALEDIYETYGYSLTASYGFVFPGIEGAARMKELMRELREDTDRYFEGSQYEKRDYLAGIDGLPKADVLTFTAKSGAKVTIRPSGTEPKIKAYLFVTEDDREIAGARMEALKEKVIACMGVDPEKTA